MHTVHFGYVVVFVQDSGEPLDATTLVFGGLGFVFFWLLAASSNDLSVRRLGVNWKRLHRFGMHYLWFIFAFTFLGRVPNEPVSTVFFFAFVAALGLRVWVYWRSRKAI